MSSPRSSSRPHGRPTPEAHRVSATAREPGSARDSGAAPHPAKRSTVTAWALWDMGSAAFNAIMTTFVFTVYLTSKSFGDTDHASATLSAGLTIAGVLIAALAPVTGQRADVGGRRTLWLGINTYATAALMAACFFVAPDPSFLLLGVGLICAANVVNEFAVVNYNALLPELSTPASVGRISGFGWACGYFGGIIALGIVLVAFIGLGADTGVLGIPAEGAYNVRSVALFAAAWCAVLSTPLLLALRRRDAAARLHPSAQQNAGGKRESLAASYQRLWGTLKRLYRTSPQTLYFLVASAVFRDGLTGVFTFGGVLAAGTFGFATTDVIIFAIVGNIVAGLGALLGGKLDDALGPKRVILASLLGILLAAAPLLVFRSAATFWICGLALCAFVGPAQSASRTYLARLTPAGQEGEIFGLYSTTGRATSFLAPALFTLFVSMLGAQIWGIVGIMAVIALGLILTLPLSPAPAAPNSTLREQKVAG